MRYLLYMPNTVPELLWKKPNLFKWGFQVEIVWLLRWPSQRKHHWPWKPVDLDLTLYTTFCWENSGEYLGATCQSSRVSADPRIGVQYESFQWAAQRMISCCWRIGYLIKCRYFWTLKNPWVFLGGQMHIQGPCLLSKSSPACLLTLPFRVNLRHCPLLWCWASSLSQRSAFLGSLASFER